MADEIVYRIHPAIGVARIGDANGDGDFFIGPEVPGQVPTGPRKRNGQVLRQAARFRVFAYKRQGTTLVLNGEVQAGVGDVAEIRWTVHLANRKAAFFRFNGLAGEPGRYHFGDDIAAEPRRNHGAPTNWEIDPGPRSIGGKDTLAVRYDATSAGRWPTNAAGQPAIDYLGELRTDADGRLLVLGGHGQSASTISPPAMLPNYANNATWLDDISDGPVTADVVLRTDAGEQVIPVEDDGKAWCLVAPPDFAPEITSIVTLYDVLVDMAARSLDLPDEQIYCGDLAWLKALNDELRAGATTLSTYRPDYTRDVFPLIERALQYRWVSDLANGAHSVLMTDPLLADPSPDAQDVRDSVLRRLRQPGIAGTKRRAMPRLLGDEPYEEDFDAAPHQQRLAVTRTQYAILERWRDGAFDAPAVVPVPGQVHSVDLSAITPWELDRAALEACVGGAFYPGIEASWQIRHAELFGAPFRIRHDAPSSYLGDDGEVVRAGHFSRQMAVPWQADFMDCREERADSADPLLAGRWGWWPSQRPDDVQPLGGAAMKSWVPPSGAGGTSDQRHEWMRTHWAKLGFVMRVDSSNDFTEFDRDPNLP